MKIKFASDGNLPLNKTLEIPIMVIVVMKTTNIIHKFFSV